MNDSRSDTNLRPISNDSADAYNVNCIAVLYYVLAVLGVNK